MKTPLIALALALAALLAACGQSGAPAGELPENPAADAGPFELDRSLLAVERSFPDYFLAHKEYFAPHVSRVGKTPVWLLRNLGGWAANSIVIEGPEGLVVYDTGVNRAHGRLLAKAIANLSDKPIAAIVYSHHHVDHVSGTDQLVDPARAASGELPIYAWHNFPAEYRDENEVVGPIMGLRAMYMFGAALPAEENVHQGCCGRQFVGGSRGYVPPNRLVEADGRFSAGGVDFELFHTGGEAASEIGLYLPAHRVVLLGDELYPALANLYTIRGAKFRDAQKWAAAGRKALAFDVEYLLGTHLPGPIVGREAITAVVETHGDAILYLHDQAVRFMLKGETPDQLSARFQALPPFLDRDPYTRAMYGTPQYNAAQQFVGYLGVHEGDATQFRRTAPAERGRRLVDLMGGRDRVLRKAQAALAEGDPQWCAELTTLALRRDPADEDARLLKAAALRTLGYAETNPQWRNWYLTGAGELDGSIDPEDLAKTISDIARGSDLPIPVLLDAMRYRVAAERIGDRRLQVAFVLTDSGEAYLLTLRNAVLHRDDVPPAEALAGADATLTLETDKVRKVLLGEADLRWALLTGGAELSGDSDALRDFFGALERGIPAVGFHSQ